MPVNVMLFDPSSESADHDAAPAMWNPFRSHENTTLHDGSAFSFDKRRSSDDAPIPEGALPGLGDMKDLLRDGGMDELRLQGREDMKDLPRDGGKGLGDMKVCSEAPEWQDCRAVFKESGEAGAEHPCEDPIQDSTNSDLEFMLGFEAERRSVVSTHPVGTRTNVAEHPTQTLQAWLSPSAQISGTAPPSEAQPVLSTNAPHTDPPQSFPQDATVTPSASPTGQRRGMGNWASSPQKRSLPPSWVAVVSARRGSLPGPWDIVRRREAQKEMLEGEVVGPPRLHGDSTHCVVGSCRCVRRSASTAALAKELRDMNAKVPW